ncbi:MAG: potassium channel family protein [Desulfurococcales archaeon]|nr:potassium channel family protein [Desulfurococcales archaeon]
MSQRVFTRNFVLLLDLLSSAITLLMAVSRVALGPLDPVVLVVEAFFSVIMVVSVLYVFNGVGFADVTASIPVLAVESLVAVSPRVIVVLYVVVGAARVFKVVRDAVLLVYMPRRHNLTLDVTLIQVAMIACLVIVAGGVGFYVTENKDRGGMVEGLGDAIWMSLVTSTTVGYGDMVPHTTGGRVVASLIMIFGVGTIGFFVSTLAANIAKMLVSEQLGEGEPPLVREKKLLARAVLHIEELGEDEFRDLIRRLNNIYTLIHASRTLERVKPQLLRSKIDGEN